MTEPENRFNKETANPLLELKFDRVYMYDYVPSSAIAMQLIVDTNGSLIAEKDIKKTVELDGRTIQDLIHFIGDSKSYGDEIMRCFIPHLAFVFYRNTDIVFHVSICLTCNNLRPSIEIPAHTAGRGMTILFRTFLNDLLDKHGFSNNVRWEE